MTVPTRTLAGQIAYRDKDDAQIGSERFEIISHAGGHVMRALCDMTEIGLLRDVTIAFDPAWRPVDAFCRVIQQGDVAAATWFCIGNQAIEVESSLAGAGRLSQHFATPGPLAYLGLHPLQGDALIVAACGENDPGTFIGIDALTNSISPNGDESFVGTPTRIDVAYIGRETIDIAAGRFAARRFALRWRADWPVADLWVREQDCVFLLMRWSMIDDWYELTDLNEA